jgi:glucokinase
MIVLGADVGGTKTRLGLFRADAHGVQATRTVTIPTDPLRAFEELLKEFLGADPPPDAACFAVAGPVIGQRVAMTNHHWVLEAASLSRLLSGAPVRIVNDLEAAAVAMPHLAPPERVTLAPGDGDGARGNVAVVAPGTGLGCASLCWDGTRHHPMASEGGHADFAPRSDDEIALLRHLRPRYGHVSWERILSGAGLAALYEFVRDTGTIPESAAVRARFADEDRAAVVSDAACRDRDPLSEAALDLFARVLGAKAGNVALEVFALGGVFIGGGIAPKIVRKLGDGTLVRAFLDKGRQRPLLERIPLHVSLVSDLPLIGAARLALSETPRAPSPR